MRSPESSLSRLFESGRFSEVLELYRRGGAGRTSNDGAIIIGSLAFLGDWELTCKLAAEWRAGMSLDQASAVRHYECFALMRASRYEESRAVLMESLRWLRWLRAESSGKNEFAYYFLNQSIAFFHFYTGRYASSRRSAKKAISIALQHRYAFGEAMSLDLLGHSQIQLGEIHEGLATFNKAKAICSAMGYTSFIDSMQFTLFQIEAFYGLRPETVVMDLQKSLDGLSPSNIFAKGELLLEISRQLFLRGRFREAERALEKAASNILQTQNRRQLAKLNLAIARLAEIRGDRLSALSQLYHAKNYLNPNIDRALLALVEGLLYKLEPTPERLDRLRALYRRGRSALQYRHLQRDGSLRGADLAYAPARGQDRLGDLFDDINGGSLRAFRAAISQGYYGLLLSYFDVKPNEKVLVVDEEKSLFWMIETDGVRPLDIGNSRILKKILNALARGPQKKETLVDEIWGRDYHPLKNDPAFFRSMSRLKALINEYTDALISDGNEYRLARNLRIAHPEAMASEAAPEPAPAAAPTRARSAPSRARTVFDKLSRRQQRAMELIEKQGEISSTEFAKFCKITRMTAYRDLQSLCELGIVYSNGKARQTRYRLQQ